jgi:opacity protein-like surface antigen
VLKRCASFLLAFSVSALVAAPLSQAKEPPPNYVTLKLGGFFPMSSDLDDINADAGFQGEIALGHNVAPGFAIEGAVGYFESKGGVSGAFGTFDEKLEIVPLTLSLRGQVPHGRFEPYGFLGLGVYFVEDKISGSIPSLGISGSASDDDTALGFHVGIGGSYTLPSNLLLGVEARYLWVEINTFDEKFRIGGVSLTGNIGYRF